MKKKSKNFIYKLKIQVFATFSGTFVTGFTRSPVDFVIVLVLILLVLLEIASLDFNAEFSSVFDTHDGSVDDILVPVDDPESTLDPGNQFFWILGVVSWDHVFRPNEPS